MQALDTYSRPALFFNGHIETIYPAVFRTVNIQKPFSERIETPDQDFLDLDWYRQDSSKLAIISHGLEGNSKRPYVLGMAKAFLNAGFDVLAWNYRGCGLEMNRQLRFYHSGATDDLDVIVAHATKQTRYKKICLIGFSLGGNLTLKYLGENYTSSSTVHKAVAISVPLDLDASCHSLSTPANGLYVNRFLKSLKAKVRAKAATMKLPIKANLNAINNLRHFDDEVTAPLHGFKDAADYYAQNSSLQFLPQINCQTLIISAINDPFLSKECFPSKIANAKVHTLFTRHGGHVGFSSFNENNLYWSELQAVNFCQPD